MQLICWGRRQQQQQQNPPTIFYVGQTFHARGINRINIVTFSVLIHIYKHCLYCIVCVLLLLLRNNVGFFPYIFLPYYRYFYTTQNKEQYAYMYTQCSMYITMVVMVIFYFPFPFMWIKFVSTTGNNTSLQLTRGQHNKINV